MAETTNNPQEILDQKLNEFFSKAHDEEWHKKHNYSSLSTKRKAMLFEDCKIECDENMYDYSNHSRCYVYNVKNEKYAYGEIGQAAWDEMKLLVKQADEDRIFAVTD